MVAFVIVKIKYDAVSSLLDFGFYNWILGESSYFPSIYEFDYDHQIGNPIDEEMRVEFFSFPVDCATTDDGLLFELLYLSFYELNFSLILVVIEQIRLG